ncbi:hypothetical protein MASR1M90_09110 [Desulfovibrionales bacterium]
MKLLNLNQYALWFSDRCNYKCSYCCNKVQPNASYSFVENHLDSLVKTLSQVDPGMIMVSGGESTLWKDLPVVMDNLLHQWCILTNGSFVPTFASHPNIKFILACYHDEYANPDRFIENMLTYKDMAKRPIVKIIVRPDNEYKHVKLWEKLNSLMIPSHFVPLEYTYFFSREFIVELVNNFRTSCLYNSRFFRNDPLTSCNCHAGTREMFQVNKDGTIVRCSTFQQQVGVDKNSTILSPSWNLISEQCNMAGKCYCEWHHWSEAAPANDNKVWSHYIETGEWMIPTKYELEQFIQDMGWDLAGRNKDNSKTSVFCEDINKTCPVQDLNSGSGIVTYIPGMPSIELVSYYDSFKDYYPYCELDTKSWFVENVEDDWIFIDSGANIGYYSILFAQLAPHGHVYAFEPTETYEMLLKNIAHHKTTNITPVKLALGNKVGKHTDKIYRIWGSEPEESQYDFATIDFFVKQAGLSRLDCIKIDVDSYDFEVLKGAKDTLIKFNPYIMVELNHALSKRGQSNVEALEWLAGLGYTEAIVIDHENFLLKRGLKISTTTNILQFPLKLYFAKSLIVNNNHRRNNEALSRNTEGEKFYKIGNTDQALSIFLETIREYPEHTLAYNNASFALLSKHSSATKALQFLEASLTVAPDDKMTLMNYITMLAGVNRRLDAVEQCVSYLKRHPSDNKIIALLKEINSQKTYEVSVNGKSINVPFVKVADLHKHLGFDNPLEYPADSLSKPFSKWKMEIDDSPIFRYVYRNFFPKRHLEFGTWQGTGTRYCLEESQATVWTINIPTGEFLPNGQTAYTSLAYGRKKEDFISWAKKANFSVIDQRSDTFGFIGWEYLEAGLGHRVCQIFCNSIDWDTSNIPEGFFDTILIDGSHEKDTVISDTKKALPLLRTGGIIMWHDCCPPEFMQYGSTVEVMDAISEVWEMIDNELAQVFWIKPSWILLGVKK